MTHIQSFSTAAQPQFSGLFNRGSKEPEYITYDEHGKMKVPNKVIVPFISGDGIGKEVMPATRNILDAAVNLAYEDKKDIEWKEAFIGAGAQEEGMDLPEGSGIPLKTRELINQAHIAIKGPTGTPVGGGARSVNVELRKMFKLFANIRPVKLLQPDLTPISTLAQDAETGETVRSAIQGIDATIFRENTEDVYSGVEFEQGSEESKRLIALLKEMGAEVPDTSALGIKVMTKEASEKIIDKAFSYAIENNKPSVTVVHKGNIQKYTEGMFNQVAQELAKSPKYADVFIDENTFYESYQGNFDNLPEGKIVLKSRIADAMLMEVNTKPNAHHVIVTSNLNGDYISDAFAGTVGGLGITAGANIGDQHAIFEAVHGTAPDIEGQNKANPTALTLSGKMMLDHLGWNEAANLVQKGIEETLRAFQMTGDLAYRFGTDALSTTDFTEAVIKNMTAIAEKIEEESGGFFKKIFGGKKEEEAA